ncbi:hypothetical protein DPMN_150760 [Dreissena polymorpha]|uniref:Uncharacterized protein n=1 Tax=Dreissena polymorpha TaxID=45954 RepID=A0A9D4FDW5_DREPO|nr:hypothetical protein DPMN_150760 [Dreissena polymorpha]
MPEKSITSQYAAILSALRRFAGGTAAGVASGSGAGTGSGAVSGTGAVSAWPFYAAWLFVHSPVPDRPPPASPISLSVPVPLLLAPLVFARHDLYPIL